jgi:hypothetical protein
MKKISTLIIIMLIGSVMISGCKKDDPAAIVLPTITLNAGTGYITTDSQAPCGDTLNIGIIAKANGTDNLVKFSVFVNGQNVKDSTINTQNFVFNFYSLKTALDTEVWKFVTRDIAGSEVTKSFTITRKSGIDSYASITLGAQNNTTFESFLSYSNNTFTKYFQAAAFANQALIDMFCFYENTALHQNFMTLAAPGSNITGIFTGTTAPDFYTTKSVTYFTKTTLSAAQFDATLDDAVFVSSFNPDNKFKKAKVLAVGDVYAFLIQSGKYGLLKVTAVTGVEDGSLEMAVKIQK